MDSPYCLAQINEDTWVLLPKRCWLLFIWKRVTSWAYYQFILLNQRAPKRDSPAHYGKNCGTGLSPTLAWMDRGTASNQNTCTLGDDTKLHPVKKCGVCPRRNSLSQAAVVLADEIYTSSNFQSASECFKLLWFLESDGDGIESYQCFKS
jgi:hypothetical protein